MYHIGSFRQAGFAVVIILLCLLPAHTHAQSFDADALCAQIDQAWGQDWTTVIDALETLTEQAIDCSQDRPSRGVLYAAYVNYAAVLVNDQQIEQAIQSYQAALLLNPDGREALAGLTELGGELPAPPPLETCPNTVINAAHQQLPDYQVTSVEPFITADGTRLMAGDTPFVPMGVNYYPAYAPWQRFLLETDISTVAADFARFQATGFNTVRVFLRYDALFMCAGNGAVPQPDRVRFFDDLIHQAAAHHLRVIVTLHDLPDLIWYPLYSDPQHVRQQTAFILRRYRDEPTILAWDVRNEGDIDYHRGTQNKTDVYNWLAVVTERVRTAAPHHLITAGWLEDVELTIPYVDFLSIHHWSSPLQLRSQAASLRSKTPKPILLGEFGFSTIDIGQTLQRTLLVETIKAASAEGLAGWLVWTAYDFPTDVTCIPPACPSEENFEHHMGLWHSDGTPKAAVAALQHQTQQPFPQPSPLDFRLLMLLVCLLGIGLCLAILSILRRIGKRIRAPQLDQN